MRSTLCLATTLLLLLTYLHPTQAIDCFGWSVTKRVNYLEVLPMMMYYDHVNWINLDPLKTCTFKTFEAVFLKTFSSNLIVSYQPYKEVDFKCALESTTATAYKNTTWLYSNHILQDSPDICGFLVTVQNNHTTQPQMFQVIRTNAMLVKASAVAIVGMLSLYLSL